MEIIADYRDVCGECPVWDPKSQSLYWTDCVGLRFYKYNSHTQKHSMLHSGFEINGFRLNNEGAEFCVTNNSGIWLWNKKQKPYLIASEIDGKKCRMNDCTADPQGRLLAGSWFYNADRDYPLGHLIVVNTDLTATVLDEGFDLANGIALSPDCSTVYVADSVARTIYAYDYNVRTASVKRKRILVALPAEEGLPDGLAVDQEGYVWAALWYGGCVVRLDPDGVIERRLVVPAKQVSAVAFGGLDLSELFVTTAGHSEPMPIMPPGYDATSGYFGGALFRTQSGVCGLPQLRTKLDNSRVSA